MMELLCAIAGLTAIVALLSDSDTVRAELAATTIVLVSVLAALYLTTGSIQ